MTESTYAVSGMICGHCADFVTEELQRLDGVTAISVDVDNGTVTLTSENELDIAHVRAAVDEAGYELTAARD
ncbi:MULTISPECIES: heavy-metal-associated domain-containing protein [Thermomonosporaceae]|uniref:heavy-metal-associated domain-containing protein n=1 Tax=Thermomonosporaceae TaxID=2012 RepID=UPI00255AC174|nr:MULTISPECIES: heavy-metal-associated domain-containing protein [Thermomonosporaceae]MDL4775809.1 heavy-metal-associated domain-containing protein [Actinomadura xylanilytica]